MDVWFDQLKQVADKKHMEQVAFLKENFGMGHEYASAIVLMQKECVANGFKDLRLWISTLPALMRPSA